MTLANDLNKIVDSVFDNTLIPGLRIVEAVDFYKLVPGTYDPTTGNPGVTFDPALPITAAVVRYNEKQIAASGGLIRAGDLKMIFRKTNALPEVKIKDQVEWLGTRYEIVAEVKNKRLDQDGIVFICQVRK